MNITYDDLKFVRGKRKNDELMKLADEKRDLEYRRLFIEESKLDMLVAYTRSEFFKDAFHVSLLISGLSIVCTLPIFKFALLFAILFKITSALYNRQYRKFVKTTKTTLLLVDGVIKNTYGISLPKYL